jgi:hypothetical protein
LTSRVAIPLALIWVCLLCAWWIVGSMWVDYFRARRGRSKDTGGPQSRS